jgi:hypothetical protein
VYRPVLPPSKALKSFRDTIRNDQSQSLSPLSLLTGCILRKLGAQNLLPEQSTATLTTHYIGIAASQRPRDLETSDLLRLRTIPHYMAWWGCTRRKSDTTRYRQVLKTCRRAATHPCAFVDIKTSEAGSDFAEEMKGDGAGSGGVGNYCGSGGPAFLPIV